MTPPVRVCKKPLLPRAPSLAAPRTSHRARRDALQQVGGGGVGRKERFDRQLGEGYVDRGTEDHRRAQQRECAVLRVETQRHRYRYLITVRVGLIGVPRVSIAGVLTQFLKQI